MPVIVFTAPSSVATTATLRKLDHYEIEYTTRDIATDTEAQEIVKDLGYLQPPVVLTDDDHWCGFRPDKIDLIPKEKDDQFKQRPL